MADDKKPDTSNYVEHLRLVHLTLVLTCVVSIVALWSQESSSAGRAYEQLNSLLQIKEKWQSGKWVREISGIDKTSAVEANGLEAGKPPAHFRFESSVQLVRKDGTPVRRDDGDLFDEEKAQFDFTDVAHARIIWNALKDVDQLVTPSEVGVVAEVVGPTGSAGDPIGGSRSVQADAGGARCRKL